MRVFVEKKQKTEEKLLGDVNFRASSPPGMAAGGG